ncbi:MAG: dockerin type I domain-containing protein [Isosphaeraceae bacterium]
MIPSHKVPRQKRGQRFTLEPLEDRQLLSSGEGSTFAIMPGTIAKSGQISTVKFTLNSSEFKPSHGGKILLGIDVAADSSTNLKPQIVGVQTANGHSAGELIRSMYTATIIKSKKLSNPLTSAVLIRLAVPKTGQAPATYTIDVRGLSGTTGNYLIGYYLPGDVAGTGTVTQADLSTIASEKGATPTSSNYNFDADVNRDGKISPADLALASMNLGASTTVSPIINVMLDPATDGPLNDRITSFQTVHFTGTVSPGATVTFTEINHNSPGATTTADASGNYSIMVPLGNGSNTFNVTTMDGFGQSISGQIEPVTYSTNPPQIINSPSQLATTSTGAMPASTSSSTTSTSTSSTSTS